MLFGKLAVIVLTQYQLEVVLSPLIGQLWVKQTWFL